jgi:RNA polymerase sigma-70 factor (ECF subfamily)
VLTLSEADNDQDVAVTDELLDQATFWNQVEPHWETMARVASRLAGSNDRDDVLQATVTIAWRRRGTFDPEKGTIRAWLLALTADQAKKIWRKGPPQSEVDQPSAGPVDADAIERRVDIDRAVNRLPTRQRMAVLLFYFCDLPVRDVASIMDCSEGTIKSTLSDARSRLTKILGSGYL